MNFAAQPGHRPSRPDWLERASSTDPHRRHWNWKRRPSTLDFGAGGVASNGWPQLGHSTAPPTCGQGTANTAPQCGHRAGMGS
jgi:hypothetical protein